MPTYYGVYLLFSFLELAGIYKGIPTNTVTHTGVPAMNTNNEIDPGIISKYVKTIEPFVRFHFSLVVIEIT